MGKVFSLGFTSVKKKMLLAITQLCLVCFNGLGNLGGSMADPRNLRPSKLVSVGVETLNI